MKDERRDSRKNINTSEAAMVCGLLPLKWGSSLGIKYASNSNSFIFALKASNFDAGVMTLLSESDAIGDSAVAELIDRLVILLLEDADANNDDDPPRMRKV